MPSLCGSSPRAARLGKGLPCCAETLVCTQTIVCVLFLTQRPICFFVLIACIACEHQTKWETWIMGR